MTTRYKSPTGWTAEVCQLEDLEIGAMFKLSSGAESPTYIREGRQEDGMIEYHRQDDINDHGLFYGNTTVYCNWSCSLLNKKNFSEGAIEQFFSTYMIWVEPEQVIAQIQEGYIKAQKEGDADFCIYVHDELMHRIGVRFFVKDDVRIGVLFPYIGNVTVASVTGDDWESEIYHEELEA